MKKTILCALAATLMLSSCIVYHPQMVSLPLLKEKGETQIDASFSIDPLFLPSANISAAHGLTDHLALQAAANLMPNGSNGCYYGQAAPGYYLPLPHSMVFEAYGGAGLGTSRYEPNDAKTEHYQADYQIGFAQCNFGFRDLTAAHIDLGIGLKGGIMHVNYSREKADTPTKEGQGNTALIEPHLLVRLGGEHVKLTLQAGYTYLPQTYGQEAGFSYLPFNAALGMAFHF